MASVREQILVDITARIAAITSPIIDQVVRSRQVPVRKDEGVVVVVEPVEEEITGMPAQRVERLLQVRISIRARGTVPDQVADPIALAIYAALMGTDDSRRLGGLAALPLQELSRTFPMEDADGDAIDYQLFFVVPYRTTLVSEETVG